MNAAIDGQDLAGNAVAPAECDDLLSDIVSTHSTLEYSQLFRGLNHHLRETLRHTRSLDQAWSYAVHRNVRRQRDRQAPSEMDERGLAACIGDAAASRNQPGN